MTVICQLSAGHALLFQDSATAAKWWETPPPSPTSSSSFSRCTCIHRCTLLTSLSIHLHFSLSLSPAFVLFIFISFCLNNLYFPSLLRSVSFRLQNESWQLTSVEQSRVQQPPKQRPRLCNTTRMQTYTETYSGDSIIRLLAPVSICTRDVCLVLRMNLRDRWSVSACMCA